MKTHGIVYGITSSKTRHSTTVVRIWLALGENGHSPEGDETGNLGEGEKEGHVPPLSNK